MSSDLRTFFDERESEVEEYFSFLTNLNIDGNLSFSLELNGGSPFALSETQIKIFKSNCFLILYNQIEGTVNKSLEFVFDSINDSDKKYSELTSSIKSIWLKNTLTPAMRDDMGLLSAFIDEVSDKVFNLDLESFTKKNSSYFSSGNLDARSIRDGLAPRIGLDFDEREDNLLQIKTWRNQLAHGEKSFSELAQGKSLSDIVPYKISTNNYLVKYVVAIEDFVGQSRFVA